MFCRVWRLCKHLTPCIVYLTPHTWQPSPHLASREELTVSNCWNFANGDCGLVDQAGEAGVDCVVGTTPPLSRSPANNKHHTGDWQPAANICPSHCNLLGRSVNKSRWAERRHQTMPTLPPLTMTTIITDSLVMTLSMSHQASSSRLVSWGHQKFI